MDKGKPQPRSRPRSPPETRPQKSCSTSNKMRHPDSEGKRSLPQESKLPIAETKDEARTEMEVTDDCKVTEQAAAAASSSSDAVTDQHLSVVKGSPKKKAARFRGKKIVAHTIAWQKILRMTAPNGRRHTRPCKFHTEGSCSAGSNCGFAHLSTCTYWKESKCVLEDRCIFPHWEPQSPDVEELQPRDVEDHQPHAVEEHPLYDVEEPLPYDTEYDYASTNSIWNDYDYYLAWVHYEEYCAAWNYYEEDPVLWYYYDESQVPEEGYSCPEPCPESQLNPEVLTVPIAKSYVGTKAEVTVDPSSPPLMSPPPRKTRVGVLKNEEKLQAQAKPIEVAVLPRHTPYVLLSTPSTQCAHYELALNYLSPPIEDGERCHICDRPARSLRMRMAWCRNCSAAILGHREVQSMGEYPKRETHPHALELVNRWYRLSVRMRRSRMWFRWEKKVTFGREEIHQHDIPSENQLRPTKSTPRKMRNRGMRGHRTLRLTPESLEELQRFLGTSSSSGSAYNRPGSAYERFSISP